MTAPRQHTHYINILVVTENKPDRTSLYKQVRTNAARKKKGSRHVLTLKFLF